MRIFECNKCGEVWGTQGDVPYEHECEEEGQVEEEKGETK